MKKHILIFDVNETLLDLKALDPVFKRVFGDSSVRTLWFGQFIQSALVSTVTNSYSEFGLIGKAALEMTAQRKGVYLSDENKHEILSGILQLPPHLEVDKGLKSLRDAGFCLAALTNSTQRVVKKQLENAKLIQYFDKVLSADEAKRLKPAKEAYIVAAKSFGVELKALRLVAAHAWDIAGALRAGCAAAFVARPGIVLDPLVEKPDIVGMDLCEVANQIIVMEH
ncbi:MAG TPA: haloacid dehalogenase type II [Candidatus Limnocylindrales bacterium]|nr:haloacid dehalogenase type II [Candidatus Limnocylindrales bacterium]